MMRCVVSSFRVAMTRKSILSPNHFSPPSISQVYTIDVKITHVPDSIQRWRTIGRRFTDFRRLDEKLSTEHPTLMASRRLFIPGVLVNYSQARIDKRRKQLEQWLRGLV